jgi:hypothetical protein
MPHKHRHRDTLSWECDDTTPPHRLCTERTSHGACWLQRCCTVPSRRCEITYCCNAAFCSSLPAIGTVTAVRACVLPRALLERRLAALCNMHSHCERRQGALSWSDHRCSARQAPAGHTCMCFSWLCSMAARPAEHRAALCGVQAGTRCNWGLPMLVQPLKRNGGKGEPRYLGCAGPGGGAREAASQRDTATESNGGQHGQTHSAESARMLAGTNTGRTEAQQSCTTQPSRGEQLGRAGGCAARLST